MDPHSLALALQLWFDKPAATRPDKWREKFTTTIYEALPIGNAHMGALITGGVANEVLRLNEDSLWTGNAKVEGAYQALADLAISLPEHTAPTSYRRDLDLSQALSHVSYEDHGVHFQREYFASHPGNVMVVRLTADKPGSYTGRITLRDDHNAPTQADGHLLTSAGALPGNGLLYETEVAVLNDHGAQQATDSGINFKGCDSITLIISCGTDYAMNFDQHYRGEPPHAKVAQAIAAATPQSYETLKAAHIRDYQALFNRCALVLGDATPEQRAMPTDVRKKLASKVYDAGIEELIFQYGRYLLISSSRPGGLPANLQGLWNDTNTPAWASDYHANINVQMNYWPAEVTNLAECHLPLFDYIRSQIPVWRSVSETSKDLLTPDGKFATHGWAIRTACNIFGETDWNWDKTANAWYCQHFWEHYAYGLDKGYLSQVAYPVMKDICEFWEDHLKALPDGRLVVPNGWSPEHGPHQDGVSYNQQIVWDLFNNYVQASEALGVDADYRAKIAGMRDKLVGPAIGSWGQIMEWMVSPNDPRDPKLDTPDDHHRHTSHLFAVFPGRQIGITKTPDLAAAAKVSIKARGNLGEVKEWSYAWRTALYARLHDAADAHDQVEHFLGTTTPNLFGNHPPMQMDGNFGITAAMAEMLVQSHEGEINLLPALPAEWKTGSIKGLRARGGFVVDLAWQDGVLAGVAVHSTAGTECTLRYGSRTARLTLSPGRSVELDGNLGKRQAARAAAPAEYARVP